MKIRVLLLSLLPMLAFLAYSSPVKSNEAAKGIAFADDGSAIPSAADYIQDGLILMYDGIENAGWGVHDPEATTWTELVGLPFIACDLPMRDHTILENGILCESKLPMVKRPADPYAFMVEISEGYTMQLAARFPEDGVSGDLAGINASGFEFTSRVDSYGQLFLFYTCSPKIQRGVREVPLSTTFTIVGDAVAKYTKFLYDETIFWNVQSFSIFNDDGRFYPAIGINSGGRVSDTYGTGAGGGVIYHNFRIYNRALTQAEIEYNNQIDKERFGL